MDHPIGRARTSMRITRWALKWRIDICDSTCRNKTPASLLRRESLGERRQDPGPAIFVLTPQFVVRDARVAHRDFGLVPASLEGHGYDGLEALSRFGDPRVLHASRAINPKEAPVMRPRM